MLCLRCNANSAKLPFRETWLCIKCYQTAVEESNADRIRRGLPVMANFVSVPCMGCGSTDVDADGLLFWCNGDCQMVVRVAQRLP